MTSLFATILEQVRGLSVLDAIAVVAAIAYLLLAIRQNIGCWYFAGISTAIYIYLFFDARLYMESTLNIFYFAMAVYGWYCWRNKRTDDQQLLVAVWPLRRHVLAISAIVLISIANAVILETWTDAALPYVDSLTTWSAIWTTFLVARKVLENWWYWLVIDSVSVFIYWSRDLELTALLFVAYVIMIPFGLVSWRRSMAAQVAA